MSNLINNYQNSHAITKVDETSIRKYRQIKICVKEIPVNKKTAHDKLPMFRITDLEIRYVKS